MTESCGSREKNHAFGRDNQEVEYTWPPARRKDHIREEIKRKSLAAVETRGLHRGLSYRKSRHS